MSSFNQGIVFLQGIVYSQGIVFSALAFLLVLAGPARSQVGPIDSGRVLDANLRMGSGGINRTLPGGLPNRSNLVITGNVTGGHSFRGFSPIRDTSELFVNTPSSLLSNFRRDSIGVGQLDRGIRGGEHLPYFSRSRSVTNTGAIGLGLNQPGSSVPLSRNFVPRYRATQTEGAHAVSGVRLMPKLEPIDLRTFAPGPVDLRQPAEDRRIVPVQSPLLESSSLFRRIAGLEARLLEGRRLTGEAGPADVEGRYRDAEGRPGVGLERGELLEREAGLADAAQRSSGVPRLERRVDNRVEGRVEGRVMIEPAGGERIAQETFGVTVNRATVNREGEAGSVPALPGTDAASVESGEPGIARMTAEPIFRSLAGDEASAETRMRGNVFRAMQMTVASLLEANRGPVVDVKLRIGGITDALSPGGKGEAGQTAAVADAERPKSFPEALRAIEAESADGEQAEADPFRKFLEAPVKTFVGSDRTRVNEYMARGEAYLQAGAYYRAKTAFEAARSLDPKNPLPILGRAHASLGAGEYLSASRQLLRAISMFPQIAWFRIDLRAMVPREDLLDVRRADLESLLEGDENPKFRFLLGYVEYYSGLEKFGLEDMSKAADALGPTSAAARFVAMLKEGFEDLSPGAPGED